MQRARPSNPTHNLTPVAFWKRKLTLKAALIIVCMASMLLAFLYVYPTGKAVFLPGRPLLAHNFITTTASDPNTGKLYLLPVRVSERAWTLPAVPAINANPLMVGIGWFYPGAKAYPVTDYVRSGTNQQTYRVQNAAVNTHAQIIPVMLALDEANVSYVVHGDGIRVIGFNDDGEASSHLQIGDIIVSADNQSTGTIQELHHVLANNTNETITLTFVRDQTTWTVAIPLRSGRLGILVDETSHYVSFGNDTLRIRQLRGSSGDVGFALQIYAVATQQDITRGRSIAVTGTLLPNGTVLPVGAGDLKAWEAKRAGVDLYIGHPIDAAYATQEGINAIGVRTLREAIDAINR